jgi:ribokinase
MDLVIKTRRVPQAGETIAGEHFATIPGGKVANQAAAIVRLGGWVR